MQGAGEGRARGRRVSFAQTGAKQAGEGAGKRPNGNEVTLEAKIENYASS